MLCLKNDCPFCNQPVNPRHIYLCKDNLDLSLSKKDIKYLYIAHNFPIISELNTIQKEYIFNEMTLPEAKSKYGISYKAFLFLIDYFEIQPRTHKESVNLKKTKIKRKKSCIEKYGKPNALCKGTVSFKKRNETVLKKWGVENVFQHPKIKAKVADDKTYINRYSMTLSDLKSVRSKAAWKSKTEEEKKKWLNKSILSDSSKRKRRKGIRISSLEKKVERGLISIGIQYQVQFLINFSNCYRYYDFFLPGNNLLIEVFGDYYHANPKIYKADDLLLSRSNGKTAKELWKANNKRLLLAKNAGYKTAVIWESDLKEILEIEMPKYLEKIIQES